MSIPGGPKEPNFQQFLNKLRTLNAEKAALYDKLNALKGNGPKTEDPARQKFFAEQQQLRDKISGLKSEQKTERDQAKSKRDEMQRIRTDRRKLESELQELSGEVGLFRDVTDVEAAMDRLLFKMETGIGDLKAEKLCSKRLAQLERVKGLLEKVQPLTEALEEYEDLEASLAEETRNIHLSLDDINKKITDTLEEKIKKDGQRGGFDEQREKLKKEREDIIAKIRALATKIDDLRKEFDESRKAWNEWREVAKERFAKEQQAKREERERRRAEIEKKRKEERKMRRAAKKLNPYVAEIEICDSLSRVLKDKMEVAEQDRLKAERARKLAEFDASASAPQGQQLKKDVMGDDWLFLDRSSKTAKNQQKQHKQAEKPASAAAAGSSGSNSVQPLEHRPLHLPNDRLGQFGSLQIKAPTTFGEIKKAVEELTAKKKHFESFKKTLDEVSTDESSDDENNNNNAGDDDATSRAAAAAVAAVIAAEQEHKK